jgi:hypothetical protein
LFESVRYAIVIHRVACRDANVENKIERSIGSDDTDVTNTRAFGAMLKRKIIVGFCYKQGESMVFREQQPRLPSVNFAWRGVLTFS